MKIAILLDNDGVLSAYSDAPIDEKVSVLIANYYVDTGMPDLFVDYDGALVEMVCETAFPDGRITDSLFQVYVDNTPGTSIGDDGNLVEGEE